MAVHRFNGETLTGSPPSLPYDSREPMNLLTPPTRTTRQNHPCRNCGAATSIDVVTGVLTKDDLTDFFGHRRNRGVCPACGTQVEAPVRVTVDLGSDAIPVHECVPLFMLEDPEVLEHLIHHTPDAVHRVYSLAELERSIEAHVRMEMRRQGVVPDDGILFDGHPDS